jgi:hypothetical protein
MFWESWRHLCDTSQFRSQAQDVFDKPIFSYQNLIFCFGDGKSLEVKPSLELFAVYLT